jgi:hypothetical protein
MANVSPKYYCHTCKAEIIPVPGRDELTCPTCSSEFVEEIDLDDPPTTATTPPIHTPTPTHNPIPTPNVMPQIIFGPSNDLLTLAQTFHQLIRMHPPNTPLNSNNNSINNTNTNTNTNNNTHTFTFQAGPVPLQNNFMFKCVFLCSFLLSEMFS